MNRQTWTAIVAAVTFVVLTAVVALWPIPFVTWGPGRTVDLLAAGGQGKPAITVKGVKTYPTSGQLRMTTVSVTRVDANLTLPEALYAQVARHHDVLPRDAVYPPSKSVEDVNAEEVAQMDSAQSNAIVAALRAAHQPVQEMPMVSTVAVAGPSHGKLVPGDLVQRIDQTPVKTPAQADKIIAAHQVGDRVVFSVLRDGKPKDVTITTVGSNGRKDVATDGARIDMGYRYEPTVSYGIDPSVVGPSAGLVFSMAIYDLITSGNLVGGRSVAGTGTIDAHGRVGAIGGIQEKIAGAQEAGAQVFLVPAANCVDLGGMHTPLTLVKVASLSDAIASLTALAANPQATVPHC